MMFNVKMPILVAMISTLPAYMVVIQYAISVVGLFEFTKVHGLRATWRSPLWMLVAFLPYQWLLSYGALRAVWRQLRGMNTWEKTAHIGAHRAGAQAAAPTPPGGRVAFEREDLTHA
jgi:glycosyltransferase XagB